MARPKDHETGQQTHAQDNLERHDSGPTTRADRRLRDAIEDDDALEALKSLHECEARRGKAG